MSIKHRLVRKAVQMKDYMEQYNAPDFQEREEKAMAKLKSMDNDALADLITDQVFDEGGDAPSNMVNDIAESLDWDAGNDWFSKFGYRILSPENEDDIKLVMNDKGYQESFEAEYADEEFATEKEYNDAFYNYVCEVLLGEVGVVERLSDGELIGCGANAYGMDRFFDSLDLKYDRENVHYTIMYALEHIRDEFLDNIVSPETFFDVPKLVSLVNYIEKNCE